MVQNSTNMYKIAKNFFYVGAHLSRFSDIFDGLNEKE